MAIRTGTNYHNRIDVGWKWNKRYTNIPTMHLDIERSRSNALQWSQRGAYYSRILGQLRSKLRFSSVMDHVHRKETLYKQKLQNDSTCHNNGDFDVVSMLRPLRGADCWSAASQIWTRTTLHAAYRHHSSTGEVDMLSKHLITTKTDAKVKLFPLTQRTANPSKGSATAKTWRDWIFAQD